MEQVKKMLDKGISLKFKLQGDHGEFLRVTAEDPVGTAFSRMCLLREDLDLEKVLKKLEDLFFEKWVRAE